MTVKELIDKLHQFDADLIVEKIDSSTGWHHWISKLSLERNEDEEYNFVAIK